MERLANGLDQVNLRVGQAVRWLALLMVLLQFVIVLFRYVFGYSSIFLNEGVLYFHATIFMLGAGYTLLMDGHVRVDIFYSGLNRRHRALVDVFGHLALFAPGLIVLLYFSWPTVRRSWEIYEGAISVGGIPASFLLKSLIPAFAILLLIQGIAVLLRDLARLKGQAE